MGTRFVPCRVSYISPYRNTDRIFQNVAIKSATKAATSAPCLEVLLEMSHLLSYLHQLQNSSPLS